MKCNEKMRGETMIDIHCHILPKLDDGAADMEEALGIARAAVASGVTGIVATPHFPGRPESLEMLGAILDRYRSLRICLEKAGIPLRIFPGAEILCLPNTAKMARQRQLPTLGNSDYLLCEFYFQESRAYMTRQLRELADSGYRIVVAHPERYEAVQRDPRIAEKWFDAGYVLQLNKDSLLGNFGSRVEKTARTLLDRGLAHVIASDAHSTLYRTGDMGQLRSWLEVNCPAEYARILLEENPRRLLQGREMAPVE